MQQVDITIGQVTFSAVLDRELVLLRVANLLAGGGGGIAAERPSWPRFPSPPRTAGAAPRRAPEAPTEASPPRGLRRAAGRNQRRGLLFISFRTPAGVSMDIGLTFRGPSTACIAWACTQQLPAVFSHRVRLISRAVPIPGP